MAVEVKTKTEYLDYLQADGSPRRAYKGCRGVGIRQNCCHMGILSCLCLVPEANDLATARALVHYHICRWLNWFWNLQAVILMKLILQASFFAASELKLLSRQAGVRGTKNAAPTRPYRQCVDCDYRHTVSLVLQEIEPLQWTGKFYS